MSSLIGGFWPYLLLALAIGIAAGWFAYPGNSGGR
jgi:hypothetical protein